MTLLIKLPEHHTFTLICSLLEIAWNKMSIDLSKGLDDFNQYRTSLDLEQDFLKKINLLNHCFSWPKCPFILHKVAIISSSSLAFWCMIPLRQVAAILLVFFPHDTLSLYMFVLPNFVLLE